MKVDFWVTAQIFLQLRSTVSVTAGLHKLWGQREQSRRKILQREQPETPKPILPGAAAVVEFAAHALVRNFKGKFGIRRAEVGNLSTSGPTFLLGRGFESVRPTGNSFALFERPTSDLKSVFVKPGLKKIVATETLGIDPDRNGCIG